MALSKAGTSLQPSPPSARPKQWHAPARLKRWAGDHTGRAALLIGALVALAWAPQLISFQQRDDSTRTSWRFLPARDGLENLELQWLDARFVARGIVKPKSVDKIAIVGIDQHSLSAVGQWPWPRSLHARLIDRLKAAGARVILLDMDFSDHQFPGPDGSLSVEDKTLIAAAERAGNVVLPSFLNVSAGNKGTRNLDYRLVTPFVADLRGNAGLDEVTPDLGFAGLAADADGIHRRYPFAVQISGETIGGFAALGAGVYQNLINSQNSENYQKALKSGVWPALDNSAIVPLRATQLEGANAPKLEQMPLYYFGPGGTFPTYSYSDVLSGTDAATMKQRFGGRIVLVGASALILKDNFPCPRFTSASDDVAPTIPGVELHATALAMLLDGTFLRPPIGWVSWLSLFGLAVICALWTERARPFVSRRARAAQGRWSARGQRGRIYDVVWFALYLVAAALPLLAFWALCTAAFRLQNLWIVATYPMGAGLCASATMGLFLFTLESSGRRKVVQQLGLYMDSQVVEEILAHPEAQYPRPRRTEASVLFTDIEGFTSYSEAHDADEVVAALNAFFSRMKPIVTAHGGSIDKFIGDAMMCFFGVPLPRTDHARRALLCAIELQEECARFRGETGIPFRIRIGVHTGELIVGSVGSNAANGSAAHMNYTVIGDTVNLASRLEAKNKEFGTWILCSRATGEAAPDVAQFRGARTSIKGLSGPVDVLAVVGTPARPFRAQVWSARSASDIERAEVALASGQITPELGGERAQLAGANGETASEIGGAERALPASSVSSALLETVSSGQTYDAL